MSEEIPFDLSKAGPAMRIIRKRRWCLWGVILIYLPAMSITSRLNPTFRALAIAYFGWIILLFAAGIYSALAKCPRCGNYFHMHGMTLLYLRKCLHCGLHVTADRNH